MQNILLETWKFLKTCLSFKQSSNLSENHEQLCNKNNKVSGKNKIETPKKIWIDDFICLRSKMYAFKCGTKSENKLRGICKSQSKNINFEENKKCLDGGENQKE